MTRRLNDVGGIVFERDCPAHTLVSFDERVDATSCIRRALSSSHRCPVEHIEPSARVHTRGGNDGTPFMMTRKTRGAASMWRLYRRWG
jgi:hypothetical protein